ncbi:MAG: hypothetical protein HYX47_00725 [Burkholderiales bacterium]|nr:hypothetical protein [Burkholderiales bacterium]
MAPNLRPIDPLTQVVFVHDYLQLVFQDQGFSIYNAAELERDGVCIAQGTPGFCDGLVALIGSRVSAVGHGETSALSLTFETGAVLHVLSNDASVRGPEAYQFNGPNNVLVVEQNL